MAGLITIQENSGTPATPSTGYINVFANSTNQLAYVQPSGAVVVPSTANVFGQTLITTAAGTTTLTKLLQHYKLYKKTTHDKQERQDNPGPEGGN